MCRKADRGEGRQSKATGTPIGIEDEQRHESRDDTSAMVLRLATSFCRASTFMTCSIFHYSTSLVLRYTPLLFIIPPSHTAGVQLLSVKN